MVGTLLSFVPKQSTDRQKILWLVGFLYKLFDVLDLYDLTYVTLILRNSKVRILWEKIIKNWES